jgi:hypothetical protein
LRIAGLSCARPSIGMIRASWIISVKISTYPGVCTSFMLLLYGPGSMPSGTPRVRQRSNRLRSSYESAGPWLRAAARRAAIRGLRLGRERRDPSVGGIHDQRRLPRLDDGLPVVQPPGRMDRLLRPRIVGRTSVFTFGRAQLVRFDLFGRQRVLPANRAGRSSGVALRKSQIPCRSGRLSAVRAPSAPEPTPALDPTTRARRRRQFAMSCVHPFRSQNPIASTTARMMPSPLL